MNEESSYIFDPESSVEMARLINQGRIITSAMGGPLSGLPALSSHANILDLACGPGGWALDVATACPDAKVTGVDISQTMIAYANTLTHTQQLSNASFHVMDIRQPLDFPTASFDLVNARLLVGALKRETWEPFLTECTRILKPGGILRITEPIDFGVSNSQALEQVMIWLALAFWKSGYGFSLDGRSYGMSHTLPRLFREANYQQVRSLAYVIEFSAQTAAWQDMYRNYQAGQSVMPPFFARAGLATIEETIALYQQVLLDMQVADFQAVWHMVSILGIKP